MSHKKKLHKENKKLIRLIISLIDCLYGLLLLPLFLFMPIFIVSFIDPNEPVTFLSGIVLLSFLSIPVMILAAIICSFFSYTRGAHKTALYCLLFPFGNIVLGIICYGLNQLAIVGVQ